MNIEFQSNGSTVDKVPGIPPDLIQHRLNCVHAFPFDINWILWKFIWTWLIHTLSCFFINLLHETRKPCTEQLLLVLLELFGPLYWTNLAIGDSCSFIYAMNYMYCNTYSVHVLVPAFIQYQNTPQRYTLCEMSSPARLKLCYSHSIFIQATFVTC